MHTKKPPNIVFVNIDECKASALSCYGNEDAYTPNIDKLSQEGILFEQSFTTMPKCAPARCSWLTGRYSHVEGHRTLPGFEIRKGENNLALELKKRGYRTGMFGKNHTMEEDFLSECFDEFYFGAKGKKKDSVEGEDPNLFRAHFRSKLHTEEELADTYHTEDGCDFIRKHKEGPFFLMLNINMPHPIYINIEPFSEIIKSRNIKLPEKESLEETPAVLRKYREVYNLEMLTEDYWRKIVEAYYSMVSFADHCVGKVLQTIDDTGIRDNTIIVFTSDHGDFAGEHGAVEKYDTLFYDCLVKVPLIIRYPDCIKEVKRIESLVENVDIMPTILALAGYDIPEWVQGKSLVGTMLESKPHRDAVFSEGGVEEHALKKACSHMDKFYDIRPNYKYKQKTMEENPWTMCRSKMVRTDKWKLVFRVNGMKELYNLQNDPNELQDVSLKPENCEIIMELMEKLLKWCINTETDYPAVMDMRA